MMGSKKLSSIQEELRADAEKNRENLEKYFAQNIRALERENPPDQEEIAFIHRLRQSLLGDNGPDGPKKNIGQREKKKLQEWTPAEDLEELLRHLQKKLQGPKKKGAAKKASRAKNSAR